MPESEIQSHSNALHEKLLKPPQNLSTEANRHFNTICRFGPEALDRNHSTNALPWNNSQKLAFAIQSLKRDDLLNTWDNVVVGKTRSRAVCCIYGNSFPLKQKIVGRNKPEHIKSSSVSQVPQK